MDVQISGNGFAPTLVKEPRPQRCGQALRRLRPQPGQGRKHGGPQIGEGTCISAQHDVHEMVIGIEGFERR